MAGIVGYISLILGGLGLLFVLALAAAAVRGYVLSWLWLWFMVPLGLPALGVTHSFGIALLIGMLVGVRSQPKLKKEVQEKKDWSDIVGMLASPWLALLIGWIAHTYFM